MIMLLYLSNNLLGIINDKQHLKFKRGISNSMIILPMKLAELTTNSLKQSWES